MSRGIIGNKEMEGGDEDCAFSICKESTASGMFSWSGLQVDSWGGWAVYMMARSTAETVGMYVVLLRASNHVRPMSWQSLLNILLALSLLVPFFFVPVTWNYQSRQRTLYLSVQTHFSNHTLSTHFPNSKSILGTTHTTWVGLRYSFILIPT